MPKNRFLSITKIVLAYKQEFRKSRVKMNQVNHVEHRNFPLPLIKVILNCLRILLNWCSSCNSCVIHFFTEQSRITNVYVNCRTYGIRKESIFHVFFGIRKLFQDRDKEGLNGKRLTHWGCHVNFARSYNWNIFWCRSWCGKPYQEDTVPDNADNSVA